MELPRNSFKAMLATAPVFGCWVGLGNAYSAELIATTGFDWLVIDGEHAPNTLLSILDQLRAVEPYRSAPIVRSVNRDPVLIKQLLDIGARTLMVPMVDTPEQAAAIVAAMRYAPGGMRGMAAGAIRADRWGSIAGYADHAEESLCLVAQIESRAGVENAAAIAGTDGVDAVFVGPYDLSNNLGHRGDLNHADVQTAITQVLTAVHAAGKAAGILAPVDTDADRYAQAGFDFIATGLDVLLLKSAAETKVARHRSAGAPRA